MSEQRENLAREGHVLTMPGTTKPPFPRRCAQTSPYRIILDITQSIFEVSRVANVPVKIVFKPESTFSSQEFICLLSSIRLDRVHDIGKRICATGRGEQVHMVRHYDPRRQSITNTIEVKQRILHDISYSTIREIRSSVTLIQVCLNSPSQLIFELC